MSNEIEQAVSSDRSVFPRLNVSVCFMPDGECENAITEYIRMAQRKIIVQAYSFSSQSIAEALIDVKKRGTPVTVFIDKDAEQKSHSLIPELRKNGIKIEVDQEEGKAHNKVMIIDNEFVITGSYNWTDIRYNHNSDTVIFIKNKCVSQMFEANYLYNQKRTKKMRIEKQLDFLYRANYGRFSPFFNIMNCGTCSVPLMDLQVKPHVGDNIEISRNKKKQQKEKSENYVVVSGCFPRYKNQNCIEFITDYIRKAKKLIYIHAYSFTHKTISDELIKARSRNIDIKLLVDQNVVSDKQDKVRLLYNLGIKVKKNMICDKGLAHDKTIIIDNEIVLSGSLNLTYSAQNRNLENVLLLMNIRVNKMFKDNFMSIWEKSKEYEHLEWWYI